MRTAYKVLAYLVAAEVAVQANGDGLGDCRARQVGRWRRGVRQVRHRGKHRDGRDAIPRGSRHPGARHQWDLCGPGARAGYC